MLDCVDAFLGDDPEYQAAFSGFLENREALKKPVLTTRSINTIINKLRKVSREEGIAMLDKAVEAQLADSVPPEGRRAADGAHAQ